MGDKSWGTFSLFFGLYYIVQFGLALCAANMMGHISRDYNCGINYDDEDGLLPRSRSVFDTALLLMGMWHIIEWFRTIMLLTVTCMGYTTVMYVYNFLFINCLFGIVAGIYAMTARFGAAGQECAVA